MYTIKKRNKTRNTVVKNITHNNKLIEKVYQDKKSTKWSAMWSYNLTSVHIMTGKCGKWEFVKKHAIFILAARLNNLQCQQILLFRSSLFFNARFFYPPHLNIRVCIFMHYRLKKFIITNFKKTQRRVQPSQNLPHKEFKKYETLNNYYFQFISDLYRDRNRSRTTHPIAFPFSL